MRVVRLSEMKRRVQPPCAVALGNFDGFHRGHRAIFDTLHTHARARNLPACALTFEPHPREFFSGFSHRLRIDSLREKLLHLKQTGIERAYVLRFDTALSQCSAHDFIEQILVQQLRAQCVITGENFHFGHQRQGNPALLKQMGKAHGFEAIALPSVLAENGEVCSSSAVRVMLSEGNIAGANALLGHAYRVLGRIQKGDGRGKTLGYPTWNVSLKHLFAPEKGVYAARAKMDNAATPIAAVVNIGTRPTFHSDTEIIMETHALEPVTTTAPHATWLEVELVEFLRPEQKFTSAEFLRAQIAQDVSLARRVLHLPQKAAP